MHTELAGVFKSNLPLIGAIGLLCPLFSGCLLDCGPAGLWTVAIGEAPMFRVGAIPLGIPLRAGGAICPRIGPGDLGRARLNVQHHKCH